MSGYDSKFIDELKSKNDLVDVASKYLKLERRGSGFWACCPFHHEKTPSFSINQREQFYYCFGCKKSGDVINFVMEMESVDFSDAVKILAERAKMPMPEKEFSDAKIKEGKKKKERILSLLVDTARFYAGNLKKSGAQKHQEYIIKRGIKAEFVAKFGIGASLDYESLPVFLKSKGYTEEEMVESGAVGSKNGRLYDSLGGRLIIPVIDGFNNVVAFCGRLLEKRDNVGKYVNTKETIVFSKGKTLFNINNLKKLKTDAGLDSVIIVEGHMDAVSLYQAGFYNVVASMGTSLTKDQARIIKRYADKVYISYDGDFAGHKAAIRGLEILSEEGLEVKVVSLPDGMDPDDVVNKLGKDAYRKFLTDALPLIDFKLDILKKTYDLTTADGKRKYANKAIEVIRESPSAAEQEDLIKTVRANTGFTFEALRRDLYKEGAPAKAEQVKVDFSGEITDKITTAERVVLAGILFNLPFGKYQDISNLNFSGIMRNGIKEVIGEKIENGEKIKFNDMYSILGEEGQEELSAIARLNEKGEMDETASKFNREQYYFDCLKTLKLENLEREKNKILTLLKEESDEERRKILANDLNKILKEKSKLAK